MWVNRLAPGRWGRYGSACRCVGEFRAGAGGTICALNGSAQLAPVTGPDTRRQAKVTRCMTSTALAGWTAGRSPDPDKQAERRGVDHCTFAPSTAAAVSSCLSCCGLGSIGSIGGIGSIGSIGGSQASRVRAAWPRYSGATNCPTCNCSGSLTAADPCSRPSSASRTGAKLRRCCGHGPWVCNAARCTGVL